MKTVFFTALLLLIIVSSSFAGPGEKVVFKNDTDNKKVEVYLGGKLFTAFIYPDNMEKQTLYPIMSASGKEITRGYPLNPRPFERTDHPHHVGLWFNFGDVNGLDFWNNSFAIKPENKHAYGTIKFRGITKENPKKGELLVSSDWVDYNGNWLLKEEATYIFSGNNRLRTIERVTKLKAIDKVTFKENKEGLMGMRVDRAFEEPSTKPEIFLDAKGIATKVPVVNSEGINGIYRNAEGVKGGDVWGKRSAWVALRADKDGEVITIAIMDNEKNINYPAWSHARGYGLFAINNLGGRAFDPKAPEVKIILNPGETITFKHLVVIGGDLTDQDLSKIHGEFK
jgi:hypothetical protein